MRFFTTILFLLLVSLANGHAQARLFYGTEIDHGYGNNSGIYTSYIRISPARLHPYDGARVTKLRLGLNAPANNVTLYFRNHLGDRRPLYSQKVGNLEAGWNEVTLTTPFDIAAVDTLCIGYKASFTGGNGVGLSRLYHPEGAWVYSNGDSQWMHVDGAVCIQAVVEGDNLPKSELAAGWMGDVIVNENDGKALVHGYVLNGGTEPVRSYTIHYWIEGEAHKQATFGERNVAEADSFILEMPTPAPGTYNLTAVVGNVDGAADGWEGNDTLRAKLYVRSSSFARRVVCEEYTGLWCGWCPRGLVGMETQKAAHPKTFIAISAHGRDPLAIKETPNYNSFINRQGGAPSCEINRDEQMDPNADNLEAAYQYYITQPTHVGVDVSAAFNEDKTAITATAQVASDIDVDNPEYRICFVITEDSITGFAQANYYSGSKTPMGGFENKPDPTTDVVFNDVARAINNFGGNAMEATHMVNGIYYPHTETLELPASIIDKRNLHVVALVIYKNKIANAATTKPIGDFANGIANANAALDGHCPVFSLTGAIVAQATIINGHVQLPDFLPHGLYIANGKKIMR